MSNAELPKTFEEWRKGKMVDAIGEAYDAWHARDAELAEKDRRIAKLEGQLQRATDLIRFARHFLHNENCISDEEYAAIVADSDGRVARLEGYDKVRTALEARIASVTYLGDIEEYTLELPGGVHIKAFEQNPLALRLAGALVTVHVRPQNLMLLPR